MFWPSFSAPCALQTVQISGRLIRRFGDAYSRSGAEEWGRPPTDSRAAGQRNGLTVSTEDTIRATVLGRQKRLAVLPAKALSHMTCGEITFA